MIHNQPTVHAVVTAKSSGVAILLSFLWLGAGNLYVGQTALGIILMIVDIPLAILAFSVIGFVIAFPLWLILAIISIAFAVQGANSFNRRNGIVVR